MLYPLASRKVRAHVQTAAARAAVTRRVHGTLLLHSTCCCQVPVDKDRASHKAPMLYDSLVADDQVRPLGREATGVAACTLCGTLVQRAGAHRGRPRARRRRSS